jgi:hypothetical protein
MTNVNYLPFDGLDDLYDGPARQPHTLVDHLLVIVRAMPRDFSLRDVYRHARELQRRFPGNTEIEAAIRAGLQTLRDAGLMEFTDNRGRYRRRPAVEPARRSAA